MDVWTGPREKSGELFVWLCRAVSVAWNQEWDGGAERRVAGAVIWALAILAYIYRGRADSVQFGPSLPCSPSDTSPYPC